MQALQLEAWDATPVVRDVPVRARTAGSTLIQISFATVGHLDATVASGKFAVSPELPYIPGVEGSGIVVESDSWPRGAAVTVRGAGVGVVRDGTWCERAVVPDEALMEAPEGMDLALAACYFVPATTAYVSVHDVCAVREGSVVHVVGASGAVGSLAVQLALEAGAIVVAITRNPERWAGIRSERLRVLGPSDDVVAEVGRQADCLIDTVAGPGMGHRLAGVMPGGVCALVGYAASPNVTLNVPNLILGDVTVIPVNMLRREDRARGIAGQLAARLAGGDLRLPITRFQPDQIASALHAVSSGATTGRAVLSFEGS